MKNATTFKRRLTHARKLAQQEDFAAALAIVDELLADWPGAASLHVLRAELIQLGEDDGPPLEEAKRSLNEALRLDDESIDAMLEKAHFEFAIEDDAKMAAKTFDTAIERSTAALVNALLGRAAALAELERRDEAFDCLARARWLQSSNGHVAVNPATLGAIRGLWEELYPVN